jgi:hypothetical protein
VDTQWNDSVYEAMNSFFNLFLQDPGQPSHDARQAIAERAFCERLQDSPFHLWQPGDAVPQKGTRILLGVAPWSGYDMRLLDVISESIRKGIALPDLRVDVFDTTHCTENADFRKYIPKLRRVFHTPVIGIWRDGHLHEVKEGYEARDMAAGLFGSTSAEIVAFVQDRLRTHSAN